MASQVKFRVLRLTKEQKDTLRTTRERRDETNEAVIAMMVQGNLHGILSSLQALGFGVSGGKKSPSRLPFDSETLTALKRGSKFSGVPATVLFSLCLRKGLPVRSVATKRTPLDEIKGLAPKAERAKEIKKGARKLLDKARHIATKESK